MIGTMRIVYVYPSLAVYGGIERILIDKMNYLAREYGQDVYMITSDQGKNPIPYHLDERVHVIDLDICFYTRYQYGLMRRIWMYFQMTCQYKNKLRRALAEIQPDILLCTTVYGVEELLDVRGNLPLVVESHVNFSHPGNWKHSIKKLYDYYWIRKADAVVTLTNDDAMDWRRISKYVHVIPNVVHLNESGVYSTCNNKRAIFVGRLVEQKGLPDLLTVWRLVHQRHPDWQLDVYGDGDILLPQDQLAGINIQLHSSVSNIFEKYTESSMLLLTSVYEPFGLVMPEAMSCGVPVVAFDCPYGPATIVTDGEDGFLVKNRDCQVFADRICQLIEDENLRQCMRKKAIHSSQRYTADKIMPQWLNLFKNLISGV